LDICIDHHINGISVSGIEVSSKEDISMWKTSFLILDSPYKSRNFAQNLMLLNKVHQSGELDLESDCRVGKYTIASHERLTVRPMEVHYESEKKVGEPN
jgi:hypothetical protein